MKNRILSMLLALTMVMGILTGCGAGGSGSSSKEITVSEALNSILEDEGEVIIYNTKSRSYKEKATQKVMSVITNSNEGHLKWDGTSVYKWEPMYDRYSPWISGPTDFFIEKSISETSSDIVTMTSKGSSNELLFGTCEHVEYEGESYMVFKTYFVRPYDNGINEDVIHTTFYIIKDTDFTKDKTIVADSADDFKGVSSIPSGGDGWNGNEYYATGFTDEEKTELGLDK